jgi:cytoskeleton protein RodZ
MSFGFSEASAQVKAARSGQTESGRSEPLEPKMPNSSKRLSTLNFDRKTGKKSLSYGIVLAAVVVMAVFYIPVFMSSQTTEVGDAEVIEPNEAPVATAPGSESAVSADGSLPLGLEAPAAAGDTAVFPALQQPAAPEGQSAPPATAAPNATGAASTTAAAPVADAAVPAAAPLASNVESVLRFNFQEQSWVTVRDANDKVLISQLNDGGSNLEVKGQAPFKLIVGNAKAVSISSNGKSVDLTSSIRGEVARITVQ